MRNERSDKYDYTKNISKQDNKTNLIETRVINRTK